MNLIFNKNWYDNYTQFYEDIYSFMDEKPNFDFENISGLDYTPSALCEYLKKHTNNEYNLFFVNFNKPSKDELKFKKIMETLIDFASVHSNIKISFELKVIFNKNDYYSYTDFYEDICIKLNAKFDCNCLEPENLAYHGAILREFIEDYYDYNVHLVFANFDLNKIAHEKTHDDYEYNTIIKIMRNFVKKYPNNTLEFINEE